MTFPQRSFIIEGNDYEKEDKFMRILYRDYNDKTLNTAEITSTAYFPEEEILQFMGDIDIAVRADKPSAEKLVRSLYLEGRVDVSGYETCDMDFLLEEFDEEDDEDIFSLADEDEEIRFCLPEEDEEPFSLSRTIRFPKKK